MYLPFLGSPMGVPLQWSLTRFICMNSAAYRNKGVVCKNTYEKCCTKAWGSRTREITKIEMPFPSLHQFLSPIPFLEFYE